MRKLIVALLAAAMIAPASAAAITFTGPGAAKPEYQAWADASLVPTPPGHIRLVLGPCPGASHLNACVPWDTRTIYMNAAGSVSERATLMHELGHVLDLRHMTRSDRLSFKRLIRDRRAWWGAWQAGKAPPGELFGDAFARCSLGEGSEHLHWYWGYGNFVNSVQPWPAICTLISRVGRRAQLDLVRPALSRLFDGR